MNTLAAHRGLGAADLGEARRGVDRHGDPGPKPIDPDHDEEPVGAVHPGCDRGAQAAGGPARLAGNQIHQGYTHGVLSMAAYQWM